MEEDALSERKAKVATYLKGLKANNTWVVYVLLALVAWFGYYIRTRNLGLLIDVTTGKYIPADPDAIGILRYVQYVVDNGRLMDIDYMRYFPTGFSSLEEFQLLTHLLANFYKVLHWINSAVTVEYAHIIYPAVAFVVALIFFFLLVRKVFNWQVAIVASFILTVLPAYLFRTMAGVSDKEAMAMIFVYLSLYLFISSMMDSRFKWAVAKGFLGGIAIGLLWLLWGGVSFVLVTVGIFMMIVVVLGRMNTTRLVSYAVFFVVALGILRIWFPARATFPAVLFSSPPVTLMFVALVLGLVHYFLFTKNLFKIKEKITFMPPVFVSFLVVGGLGLIAILILYGPSYIADTLGYVYTDLVEPFSRSRWALTVAESQQPYFTDLVSQFSWRYLLMMLAGSVLLFYEVVKNLGRQGTYLTGAYAVFIGLFSLSRYSGSSAIFNGTSNLSILAYLGSLAGFALFLLVMLYVLYRHYPDHFKRLKRLPLEYIFILVFFIFCFVGARSAVRLIFLFAPITAILVAFFAVVLVHYTLAMKQKFFRYAVWVVLLFVLVPMVYAFAQTSLVQAENSGPGFNSQWQYGMDWVRENTPEDAVFAHWWDYGYYVQTMGERATLSDGGNAHPAINHFIGRHLLTGQNETEALELLAAKEATHILMVSDEIGKYSAFSSIGADGDYDRYSWITAFGLDVSQSYETRNGTSLVYAGSTSLDDDLEYQGVVYPAYSAGIAGFIVPTTTDDSGNFVSIEQPTAVLIYNGAQVNIPLECVWFNGQELTFEVEGIPGCLQIIPSYSGDTVSVFGAGLYLSPEVYNTVFTHLYLFGEEWEYITLAYSDEDSMPLALYNGRLIGPMKIWDVAYPDDLEIPEEYYGTEIPLEVTLV